MNESVNEQHPYRASGEGAKSFFEDKEKLGAWAHKAFALWAEEQPMAPRDVSGMLRGVEPQLRVVGRMRTEIEARKLVWRQEAYRGKEAVAAAADVVRSEAVDAFGDEVEIERSSRHVAACGGCSGTGRAVCKRCSGATRTECEGCGGEGKVMGYAVDGSRRRLNCKACKGRGSFACAGCRSGKVECAGCGATGKVERWLEVEKKSRVTVRVRAMGELVGDFAWTREREDCTDEEIGKDAMLLCAVTRDGALEERDLPAEVPREWREKHWAAMPLKLAAGERVATQRLQMLALPAAELTYGFGGGEQTISFEGLRLSPPRASVDRLFHARASTLRLWGVMLAALPVAALIGYAARGSYFLNGLTFGVVMALIAVAMLLFGAVSRSTLRRPAKRWALAALLPALAAAAVMVKLEPSRAVAARQLQAGTLDEAEAELTALGRGATGEMWQELYLKRALARTTCDAVQRAMGNLTPGTLPRAQAQIHADRLALGAARRALAGGAFAAAGDELRCASDRALSGLEGMAVRVGVELGQASQCLELRDWPCALRGAEQLQSLVAPKEARKIRAQLEAQVRQEVDALMESLKTERDVRARLDAEREAISLLETYLLAPRRPREEPPAEIVALQALVRQDEAALGKLHAREEKERIAEEKKQAAAAERRLRAEERRLIAEERAAAREAARWANSPLLCGDGTQSDSCTCGRDSYRGCCSYHGGVAGCSAD